MRKRRLGLTLVLVCLAAAAGADEPSGVLVAALEPSSLAARAGLREGDRITSWEQDVPPAMETGTLSSPFDLLDLELERGPRGPLTLVGERAGEPIRTLAVPR